MLHTPAQIKTATLIDAIDWAATALGPRPHWPRSLNTVVDLLLASPVGMVLMWGDDPVMIYNDGYVPVAAARHPGAFGGRVAAVWPEIWDWNASIMARGLAGESMVYRDQHLVVERNGGPEDVWFDLFYAPVRDDAGRIAGVLCTVIETSAQIRASHQHAESERRLARSEARLSMLVNQASVGISQSDPDGTIVAANDRFCDIIGRQPEAVVGTPIESFTHPGDVATSRAAAAKLWRDGQAYIAEKRLLRPDGSFVWVSHHVSLARDAVGAPEFIIRITQDISARKQAEVLARDSTDRMQLALSTGAVLGTWSWNPHSQRLSGDARFAQTLLLDPVDAAAGVPLDQALQSIHWEDRALIRDRLRVDGGALAAFHVECRVSHGVGAWIWVEASGHLESGQDGLPQRLPGILINIDQRRRAAERQSFLITLGDKLRTIDDPQAILDRTTEATGRHLDATQVVYGEVSPDGETIELLTHWPAAAAAQERRIRTDRLGAEVARRLRTGDMSLSTAVPAWEDDHDPLARMAVPLFRDGRWHAVMMAEVRGGRHWDTSDAELLREVIGRTWDAVERARAVVTLRKAQGRQAFLLRLNDHLSEIDDPREVLETVAESLGTYLGVNRASYGEVTTETRTLVFAGAWSDGSVPPINGPVPYGGVADTEVSELLRGLTVSEDDFTIVREGRPNAGSAFAQQRIRAVLAVPLIRDGQFRAGLFLAQEQPRRWTLEEISLTQEVARRTWDALERTRAEQALQRSEARLRAMFDTLPVGIVFAEMPSGRVTEGNARVEQILGYAAFSSLDTAAFAEWVAFDENGVRVPVQEHPLYLAVSAGSTASRTFHHQRGDGTRVWVAMIAAPVRDPQGVITGGLLTIMDVDREKQAEAALRDLNTTLEQQVAARTRERDRVWRNSRDLLAVLSVGGGLVSLNPSWTEILGWSFEELVGRDFTAFLHPDDMAATAHTLEVLRDGPLAAPFENRLRRQDGSYLWFSWTASLEGAAIYANGRDVTAERLQAEALRQAEEQLRQSQKMEAVGQLTGGIAHDFNNLLTGITGALDLLGKRLAQGRTDTAERYIGMAMNSANRAAALTHRLLAFSRRQPLEAKPVDVNRLVTSMDDLVRRTIGERVTFDFALGTDLSPTLCDPHQLENALLNLVINARDAMPDGGCLTITTAEAVLQPSGPELEGGTRPGRYVSLGVSDTGTGMTPDVIARAFDPFFTTKPIGQGTGLGLSMIYGFAKQSDGTVRITSAVGAGTTVTLFLPRFTGTVVDVGERPSTGPRPGAGETILVVEDDPNVRDLVREILQDLGYQTLEASDGPSGLAMLRSDAHVDLLVTDVGLPGLNGRQLAEQGRVLRPGLRVLFITGYAENASFGGNGHLDPDMQMITKPFVVEAFASKIKEMVGN
ncbi:PAS domain S-box protein [Lichenihabitans sp. Uapishka_5]|uniref:PAS domain S-box protein n=1 Tax=Lichenihabitans sp. Uapishka_5 TaxID=3037302 RepID=UPI0029E8249A|nr:PAS domain S-box protein [Lichenihabitans sp. Uapishka_5]MDX7951656.1 PAS domain S-box protein [Lichenihabitans sp. Uapishka_5]